VAIPWTRGAVLGAAVIGILAVAMSFENSLLYFPVRELASSPEAHGLRADALALATEDGETLAGWWIHGEGKRAVLFFHGNAGNAADRLDRARILSQRFGLDVFLVDYRGYGRSTGSPSEEGLARDARAIARAALERGFSPDRIVLFGESLGSAVAARLAAESPAGAVILETPFLSIRDMARVHYPWAPAFLIRDRFDNAARVPSIAAPKLFLVAERDEIVPPEQGRRLYELAPAPKSLFVIPGAGHNDTYFAGGEAYWSAVGEFLAATGTRGGLSGR
jgi:fermentation-respiration switch protein FrsA (DUF1100 family)